MDDMFAPFRVTIPPIYYFLKSVNNETDLWIVRIVLAACLIAALAVCVHYCRADKRASQQKKGKKED